MEQPGSHTSIDALQDLLGKEGVNLDSAMDFSTFFPSLRYGWRVNSETKKPKSMEEFLQTTIYNAAAKRIGLEKQGGTDLGQTGFPIELTEDQFPNAFFLEVYYWKNRQGAEKPVPPTPKIAALTGNSQLPEEKLLDYLKRLEAEKKAIYHVHEEVEKKITTFEVPMQIPGLNVVGKVLSVKAGEQFNLKEISLDIKIPFQNMEAWLTQKQN
jgi:hypothetical protein